MHLTQTNTESFFKAYQTGEIIVRGVREKVGALPSASTDTD